MIVCMHVPPAPFFLSVHPWNTYFCVCVIERQILWGPFLQISIRFFSSGLVGNLSAMCKRCLSQS